MCEHTHAPAHGQKTVLGERPCSVRDIPRVGTSVKDDRSTISRTPPPPLLSPLHCPSSLPPSNTSVCLSSLWDFLFPGTGESGVIGRRVSFPSHPGSAPETLPLHHSSDGRSHVERRSRGWGTQPSDWRTKKQGRHSQMIFFQTLLNSIISRTSHI